MAIFGIEILAILGFMVAAYSVVANDALQTLGTFLSSNSKRPWWILWLFAASILVVVMLYGYYTQSGDIAFGRLNRLPYPEGGVQWYHVLPPIVLLVLTRYGIPVSTTFLVLTVFALTGGAETEGVLGKMLVKSGMGYVVAMLTGFLIYALISRVWSRWIHKTKDDPLPFYWTVIQWSATAFLWWQWLAQDFANIFIFLPRTTTVIDGATQVTFNSTALVIATVTMTLLLGWVFRGRGGNIQKIIDAKTNTTDVRAATVIDLLFALILFFFKEMNDVPMSTTWVFLGLIAGRELAISYFASLRPKREALRDVLLDMGRLFFGLIVSIALAVFVPWVATGNFAGF
ncbi:hypothetical protein DES40_0061 [Litorimonas taeanensis]|uniref:Phosphate/sulfate permease n=1 Tax=Litorimonas taeanensis TaxID=568099 RepID=A0A420WIA5_9PROT|nr:hypothetical protein [Litorimonas taeanensis]RKQ70761.1 hypothetical protein DES40_0061 [Litorimonas taeanensis]